MGSGRSITTSGNNLTSQQLTESGEALLLDPVHPYGQRLTTNDTFFSFPPTHPGMSQQDAKFHVKGVELIFYFSRCTGKAWEHFICA
jgi:hypothetical protein